MGLKNFIFSKQFLKHLGIAVLILIALLLITFGWLNIYTRHGEERPVPNFVGMTVDEAIDVAEISKLTVTVVDSVFSDVADRGSIVEQNPRAGFNVKKGRNISLIINSFGKEMVNMPDLVALPLRQAITLLENVGLKVGELIYRPDLSVNVVLSQQLAGEDIAQGSSIEKGTTIDLVLGMGLSNERTTVPYLIGLTLDQARERIFQSSLNVGTYLFDQTIETETDSLEAFIYMQNPLTDANETVKLGDEIYLWLTLDSTKLSIDTLLYEQANLIKLIPADSLAIDSLGGVYVEL